MSFHIEVILDRPPLPHPKINKYIIMWMKDVWMNQSINLISYVCSHRGDIGPSPPPPPKKKEEEEIYIYIIMRMKDVCIRGWWIKNMWVKDRWMQDEKIMGRWRGR